MTDKLKNLPPVSQMMRDANMMAKKQFGQNFLFDLNLTGRIARSVPDIDKLPVVEVGPGPGGLTRALLMAGAKRVVAVEMDKTAEPILSQIMAVSEGRLNVIYGDALKTDFSKTITSVISRTIHNAPFARDASRQNSHISPSVKTPQFGHG